MPDARSRPLRTPTAVVGFPRMFFTTKAEYGVRLLIPLGGQEPGHPMSLKAVAESESLPLAYLERIAALLKKAGLIEATRGAHGGYRLTRSPEDITMDVVVLALEGAIAPMDCFVDDREGRVLCSHTTDGEHCATKLMWTRVQMGVIKSLQRTTLAELVEFASPKEPVHLEIHG
jgi:Rrf2 family transcriptional regulator, cysteine metabolism repressor